MGLSPAEEEAEQAALARQRAPLSLHCGTRIIVTPKGTRIIHSTAPADTGTLEGGHDQNTGLQQPQKQQPRRGGRGRLTTTEVKDLDTSWIAGLKDRFLPILPSDVDAIVAALSKTTQSASAMQASSTPTTSSTPTASSTSSASVQRPLEDTQVVGMLVKECTNLLRRQYSVFWSQICFDSSLAEFLDSFLRYCPRSYDALPEKHVWYTTEGVHR
jgi:hypothetical protein